MATIKWVLIALVIGSIISYFVSGYFADRKIVEAHAATKVAEEAVTLERNINSKLRADLEPEIEALEEEVSTLAAENAEKDVQISQERRASTRARREVLALQEQRRTEELLISETASTQLVLRTLELIEEGYPQITNPKYRVFRGDDFVANRPAAEAFTLGLTESLTSRMIMVNQRDNIDSLENEVILTKEQKDNLNRALDKEKEALSKTNQLLFSERQLSNRHLVNITALNDEVDAYESKLKFNLFSPKCGAGGYAGVGLNAEPSVGVGIFCGWIF